MEYWTVRNMDTSRYIDLCDIIAQNLKRARAKKGLSQRKIAKLLEMPGYSSYECGYCIPSDERLKKLASFYGVEAEDFYKKDGVL